MRRTTVGSQINRASAGFLWPFSRGGGRCPDRMAGYHIHLAGVQRTWTQTQSRFRPKRDETTGRLEAMNDRYRDGTYATSHPSFDVADSPWKASLVAGMLKKNGITPKAICDVGCGAGEVLAQLQRELPADAMLHGYEVSPEALALCHLRRNDRLVFHSEDVFDSDVEAFDVALCLDVLEHVEDYIGFARRLRCRATYKVFHIPLDMNVQCVWRSRPLVESRREYGHLHYFSAETALLTLEDAGHSVVDWELSPASVARGTSRGAGFLRVPRRALSSISPSATSRLLGGYGLLALTQ